MTAFIPYGRQDISEAGIQKLLQKWSASPPLHASG